MIFCKKYEIFCKKYEIVTKDITIRNFISLKNNDLKETVYGNNNGKCSLYYLLKTAFSSKYTQKYFVSL